MDFKVYFLQIPIPVIWHKYLYHTNTDIDFFLNVLPILHFQPIPKPIPIYNILFILNRYRLLSHLADTGIGIGITDVNRYRLNSNLFKKQLPIDIAILINSPFKISIFENSNNNNPKYMIISASI
jgi:hypothetical protein